MRFPLRFFPQKTNIDFMRVRWLNFIVSLLLVAATIVLLFTKGLNLGIDFSGGLLIELHSKQEADLGVLRKSLSDGGFGEASLQYFGDQNSVLIRIQAHEGEEQGKITEQVKQTLGKTLGDDIEYRKIDYVGPTVGQELIQAGYWSVALLMVGIMLYLWFRFEWQFGAGAIVALLHDAVLMIGFYLATGYEFSLTSIAALLTIVGYSVNDSVVIYDRIRENMRKFKQMPMAEIINLSTNETISRTILTVSTTLLASLSLVLFGGEALHGFSMSLVFGLIVGTYSSVYISAPVLILFNVRADTHKK